MLVALLAAGLVAAVGAEARAARLHETRNRLGLRAHEAPGATQRAVNRWLIRHRTDLSEPTDGSWILNVFIGITRTDPGDWVGFLREGPPRDVGFSPAVATWLLDVALDQRQHRRPTGIFVESGRAVFDWIKATGIDPTTLTWEQALARSEEWHATIIAWPGASEVVLGEEDEELITEFPDGWTLWDLKTPKALDAEGAAMGHCLSDRTYGEALRGEGSFASLRDPRGRRRVTFEMEWDPSIGIGEMRILQVKAPHNHPPAGSLLDPTWRAIKALQPKPRAWGTDVLDLIPLKDLLALVRRGVRADDVQELILHRFLAGVEKPEAWSIYELDIDPLVGTELCDMTWHMEVNTPRGRHPVVVAAYFEGTPNRTLEEGTFRLFLRLEVWRFDHGKFRIVDGVSLPIPLDDVTALETLLEVGADALVARGKLVVHGARGRHPRPEVVVPKNPAERAWGAVLAMRAESEARGHLPADWRGSAPPEPQAWIEVPSDLFRESGANVFDEGKVESYATVMAEAGGWGDFPPIVGTVSQVDADDLERYEEAAAQDIAHELAWSRALTRHDLGRDYVHIENGHHRAYAAARAGIWLRVIPYDAASGEPWPQSQVDAWRHFRGQDLR